MEEYNLPDCCAVLFVSAIILYNYLIFAYKFLPALYQLHPILSIILQISFQLGHALLQISYYRAIRTSPGYLPHNINDNFQQKELEELKERSKREIQIKRKIRQKQQLKSFQKDNTIFSSQINPKQQSLTDIQGIAIQMTDQNIPNVNDELNFDEIKSITQYSYCFKCQKVRQPRTHHCKECNKCIIRMDHHCPWIANCAGQFNHKFYIVFLIYAVFSTSLCWISIVLDYITGANARNLVSEPQQLYITICGSSTFALSFCIGYLLVFQLNIASKNLTTVEYHIEGIQKNNPFTKKSIYENFSDVLGYNSRTWFLPTSPKFFKLRGDQLQYQQQVDIYDKI